mmetsp:Transcript_61749/g.106119  ORF Transcript_61749/g.106119 Transcript_61749/m.106119 type:complete len:97 (+) Transcript_61749:35-325(+)
MAFYPASAGKRLSPDPPHADLAPKEHRCGDFLAELSSQLPLRAVWDLMKANKRKILYRTLVFRFMELRLLMHTSIRSIGFCANWVCVTSSSSFFAL